MKFFSQRNRVFALYSRVRRVKIKPHLSGLTLLLGFCLLSIYFNGKNVPISIVSVSVHGEDIEIVNSTHAKLYVGYGINTFSVEFVHLLKEEERKSLVGYVFKPPPGFDVISDGTLGLTAEIEELDTKKDLLSEIHQLVSRPTGHCRKLYRSGGELECRKSYHTRPIMDGHKYICLDPHLQVITGSEDTKDCLVLSFGVGYEISFDIAIRDANCEVMMFDVEDFNNDLSMEAQFVNFYEVGLSNLRIDEYRADTESVIHLDNLNNLALKYNFADRLVNILKIDIEGSEWEVLKDMATQPYLDLIAQIAVEIHHPNMTNTNETTQETWLNSAQDIFDSLQKRGFERISFISNVMESKTDIGELLLVNSNWVDEKFREEMKEKGFGFKIPEHYE